MATYATTTAVTARLRETDPEATASVEAELRTAERDLDAHVFKHAGRFDEATKTIYGATANLPAVQRDCMEGLMADQVRYRRRMGAQFFERHQYAEVSGDGFSHAGRLDLIAPGVRVKAAAAGLAHKGGTISARRRRLDWQDVGFR